MFQTITEHDVTLTRGGKMLIESAIIETHSTNRKVLMGYICDVLTARYTGSALDYQTERMNFRTTKDILNAIDTYMFKEIRDGVVRIKPTCELRNRIDSVATM